MRIGKDIPSFFLYSYGTSTHSFDRRSQDCWPNSLSLDVSQFIIIQIQYFIVDLLYSHRYLSRLKSYVRNKACLEGCIAEGYLAKECLTFCSRYFKNVETVFTQPIRNVEESTGVVLSITLDSKSWTQSHRYVLFSCDEITPFRM